MTLDKQNKPDSTIQQAEDLSDLNLISILDSSTSHSRNARPSGASQFLPSFQIDGVIPPKESTEQTMLCSVDPKEQIKEKVEELEKTFGITVVPEGTEVKRPYVNFGWGDRKDKLISRAPTMAELQGLEAALLGTQPLDGPRDGDKKVRFYFLSEHFIANDKSVAMYCNDSDDRPSVFVYADGTKDRPPTEKETKEEPAWQTTTYSLQRVMTHELSHHYQSKIGWTGDKAPEGMAEQLGWVELKTGKGTEYGIKSKDGTIYRHCKGAILADNTYIGLKESTWVPCNEKGEFVKGASEKMLSPEKMQEQASVKPVTSYFTSMKEMHAEALCAYRLDAKWRALLLKTDANLYKVIKEQDQVEIDKAFKDQPGKLRHPDGHLVSNTPETRRAIADFEK